MEGMKGCIQRALKRLEDAKDLIVEARIALDSDDRAGSELSDFEDRIDELREELAEHSEVDLKALDEEDDE
ncbi:MAG: hypothetical protein EPN91_10790 [Salinibacterium sp.]|nr:MAG: hypothetical protein EPN91_10790 [Salinibacterium sp.]